MKNYYSNSTFTKIKKWDEFDHINEEFVGGLIKGSLGKLFNAFSKPFQDLAKDMKRMFNLDDFGSIKDIIITNLNQAIDQTKSEIPKITDENSIISIMSTMIDQLVQLSKGIEKDVKQGLGKDQQTPFIKAARSVIMGNKEAGWPGIVGALDPNNQEALKYNGGVKINYKFNRSSFEKAIASATGLKNRQNVAVKFFNDLQKDISNYINRELTDEEMKDIYNKSQTAKPEGIIDYDMLKNLQDAKTPVIYLLKGKTKNDYDPNKSEEDQNGVVNVKTIYKLDTETVTFLDKNGKPTIIKNYTDIIGPQKSQDQNVSKKVSELLGNIKNDETKMSSIAKFAEFLQDDSNKDGVKSIIDIINKK